MLQDETPVITSMLHTAGRRGLNSAESMEQLTLRKGLESVTLCIWLHYFGQNLFTWSHRTAREDWKWNRTEIYFNRRARSRCHSFLHPEKLVPPSSKGVVISQVLVRNPETTPGMLMIGICSTGNRRAERLKCKNAITQKVAAVGSFSLSWGWRTEQKLEFRGQGCLAELGNPVGYPGGDATTVQYAIRSKAIEEEETHWLFPYPAPQSPSSASLRWLKLPGSQRAKGSGKCSSMQTEQAKKNKAEIRNQTGDWSSTPTQGVDENKLLMTETLLDTISGRSWEICKMKRSFFWKLGLS